MEEVQILSMMFVKPSTQTPQKHQTYNLSFFDLLAPQVYAPSIYFYPFNPSSSSTCIQQVLKKSLSETLSLYPPMAGRLNEDGLSISCQDQGVLFFEAQANAQLAEFLSKVYKDLSLLDDFFPQDIGKAKLAEAPFLVVQATTFICGGLALAIYRSHALADGVSGTRFINHWATVAQILPGNNASNLILQDFHLPQLFPTNILGLMPPRAYSLLIDADKIVGKVFVFDGDAISAIKTKVVGSSGWGVKKYYHPSRVAVVTASIWKGLISISQAKHGYLRPSVLSLTFNLRGRTSSPVQIPENSFGNCFVPVTIRFPANNKSDDQVKLDDLAGLVGDAIETTVLGFSKASTREEISSLAIKLYTELIAGMNNKEEEDIHMLTSWCKFPFYDIDFGWGTPSWFGTRIPIMKQVVLTDTKCGNGIEAQVFLNEPDMLKFEGHSDIKAFNSTSPVEAEAEAEADASTSLLK